MSDERGGRPGPDGESPWPLYFRPGPSRWPWVAGSLALLVVVVLAVVVGVALGGDSGGPEQANDPAGPTASPTASPTSSPSPTATATPAPGATLSPSPSATATATAEPARFRCWDGARVPRLPDCTRPEGRAGLAYVFPSLAEQSCRQPEERPEDGLVLLVRCTDELGDGTRIEVEYAEWDTVDGAAARFDDEPGLTRSAAAGVIAYVGEVGGRPTAVGLFEAEPFSLSFSAPTSGQLDDAGRTVSAVPPDQLRGEPIAGG